MSVFVAVSHPRTVLLVTTVLATGTLSSACSKQESPRAETVGSTARSDARVDTAASTSIDTAAAPTTTDTAVAPAADTARAIPKRRETTKPKADTTGARQPTSMAEPSPPPPAVQPGPAPTGAQSDWLKWDAATNTVTFDLIAGGEGAKSPFNFNGYTDGEVAIVVPANSKVVMNFVQKDGTPHSAVVIEDKDPMPNMAETPAIPRAATVKASEGLPQEARDIVRFTAPESGSYRISCGVPGHGLSGMWIRFKVDPAAKEPRLEKTPRR